MSISKYSRINNISTNKLIKYLIKNKKLLNITNNPKSKLEIKDFYLFEKNIKSKILLVKEKEMNNYLKGKIHYFKLTDIEKYTLGSIEDKNILLNKVKAVKDKTLMFLDLEYKDGNYHEISFSVYSNKKLIIKEYFFVDENYKNHNKKFEILKEKEIPFQIQSRIYINNLLKKVIKNVDYIIAHNSYGERNCLAVNDIFLKKHKFICTCDLTRKLNKLNRDYSLSDSLKIYDLKFSNNMQHYAYYDVEMTKNLFYSIVE